jgi:hypothetical protein
MWAGLRLPITDKNKFSMNKGDKLLEILKNVANRETHPEEAQLQILNLFNVIQQSEQLVCVECGNSEFETWWTGDKFCKKCGTKQTNCV